MTSDSRDSERRDQGSTDTHGAGDAFIGALAARWASGVSVVEAVRFANAPPRFLLARRPTRRKPSPQIVRAPATNVLDVSINNEILGLRSRTSVQTTQKLSV
jgi:bifunctional ADP-heptose synthase (sugar kinase/adenylyltransferase)